MHLRRAPQAGRSMRSQPQGAGRRKRSARDQARRHTTEIILNIAQQQKVLTGEVLPSVSQGTTVRRLVLKTHTDSSRYTHLGLKSQHGISRVGYPLCSLLLRQIRWAVYTDLLLLG